MAAPHSNWDGNSSMPVAIRRLRCVIPSWRQLSYDCQPRVRRRSCFLACWLSRTFSSSTKCSAVLINTKVRLSFSWKHLTRNWDTIGQIWPLAHCSLVGHRRRPRQSDESSNPSSWALNKGRALNRTNFVKLEHTTWERRWSAIWTEKRAWPFRN